MQRFDENERVYLRVSTRRIKRFNLRSILSKRVVLNDEQAVFTFSTFQKEMKALLAIYISTPCSINVSFQKFTFKLCVIYEEPVGTWSG